MKKLIDFQDILLVRRVQRYANNNHNGNFNKAIRDLVCKSLPLAGENQEEPEQEKEKKAERRNNGRLTLSN